MKQELIQSMTGYKATDKDMVCNGYKFILGQWHELPDDKPLVLCNWGFHFCKYPSGVWAYKNDTGTRVFQIEAEKILKAPVEPGAEYKLVCYRIRLVEEVKIDGDSNTGDWNTGNSNTGDGNTGYWNTGYWNTGDRNTGDSNTGDRNTGDGNTGDGNTGDFHAGFFCQKEERVICFDHQTKYTRDQFNAKYINLYNELLSALSKDEQISFGKFKKLPGITKKKLDSLHKKHLDGLK